MGQPLVNSSRYSLISRGEFEVIDDQDLGGSGVRLQFQAELLLQSRYERGTIRIR